jgi:hypothetical protein
MRVYHHKQAVRYFTLYFLPLIPIQRLGEFVECQTCGVAYEPQVRDVREGAATYHKGEKDLAKLINSLKLRLEEGHPIEYMVRDLTAANLDLEVARQMIDMIVGPRRKVCGRCSLTYAEGVAICMECAEPLE